MRERKNGLVSIIVLIEYVLEVSLTTLVMRGIPLLVGCQKSIGKTVGTILQCKRPIWNCVEMVIMDSGFYVTKGLVDLREKRLFGVALIKKCRYWPANIKGDAIDAHFASKEVGNVDAVLMQ